MSTQPDQPNTPLQRLFNRPLVLNAEMVFYIAIFLLAIFTRFYDLGSRVMSHDESLHTRFSYNLYNDGDFRHTPLMHGPILFHAVALSYYLFGDNDFTARIYTSVLGVLMVLSPLLFRRWLGRWGTMLACIMLLISPLVLYYNRYIREDTPALLASILMAWAILMYLAGPEQQRRRERWLYVLAAAMIWNLGSKETAFIYIAIFGVFLALFWFARLAQYFFNWSGKALFYLSMMGILAGGVLALGMYIILDIIKFDVFSGPDEINFSQLAPIDQSIFIEWTLIAIGLVLLIVLGTLVWAYWGRLERIRWREVGWVLLWAFITCFGLVVLEERSHTAPTSTQPAVPAVPGEAAAQLAEATMRWWPMLFVWLLMIGVLIFLYAMRRRPNHGDNKDKYGRGFWGTMDLFPEVDVMMIIGTLILPWATAFIPYFMRGTATDYINIANSLPPFLSGMLGNLPDINTPEKIGQIMLGFLAWVPMMTMAICLGLAWNWRKWLTAALIFHGIFAFFFTTVFTNIAGLATGMVYSLGYWLEQQAVRRGSQPQYYYLLIIMPFYEFLAIVGSVLAMLAGYIHFWRWRRAVNDAGDRVVLAISADLPRTSSAEPEVAEAAAVPLADPAQKDPTQYTRQERNALFRMAFQAQVRRFPVYYVGAIGLVVFSLLNLLGLGRGTLLGIALAMGQVASAGMMVFMVFWLRGRAWREVNEALADGAFDIQEFKRKRRPAVETEDEPLTVDQLMQHERHQRLETLPFLLFMAWWSILNLVGYSLAGEKMPWLAIHLTFPMIFLAAWFFGKVLSRIDWSKLWHDLGWVVMIVLPLTLIASLQVFGAIFIGRGPFQGLSDAQLRQTYSWLLALIVLVGGIAGLLWLMQRLGVRFVRQMLAVVTFAVLGVVTFRSAWLAAFVNYDMATEFIVYAHGAPAIKTVLDDIEELSLRTTDGLDLKFAYDNSVSWPYSWYFRRFPNAVFVGENPTLQNLDGAVAVVVGDDKRSIVEPILEENYIRFDHIRLWWPMQDYFNLTPGRVLSAFDFAPENFTAAQIREGLFDIWWQRDYTLYGRATSKDFTITRWPVADLMHFYVRKDIARQVWQYGTGETTLFEEPAEAVNQCRANWQSDKAAMAVIEAVPPLSRPLGMAVDAAGKLYVAEEFGHRISVFDENGQLATTLGQQGSNAGQAFFNRPNSIAVAPDGSLFVADTWNYRIHHLAPDGTVLAQWGQPLEAGFAAEALPSDGFWGPRDVQVGPDGTIYVSDTGNKRIRVYRLEDGVPVYQYDLGRGGSAPGQLDEPNAIVIHPVDGRVFVADSWNRRISVFSSTGAFLTTYPVRGWYEKSGNLPFLALDATRELLYVGDPDGGRVLVYTTAGECVGSFGSRAGETSTNASFNVVSGLAVDSAGYVYVGDSTTNRILKFTPFELPAVPDNAQTGAEATAETNP